MYVDTLSTLKSLKLQKDRIADRDEQMNVRIAKEVLRQTRRGWGIDEIANAIGKSVDQTRRILREAKETYGDAYVSGVIYADKKGQANPAARTTPKWLPGMPKKGAEKPKKEKKDNQAKGNKTDGEQPAPAKKKLPKKSGPKSLEKPAPKKKRGGGKKPPVQVGDEVHYEEPTFAPDAMDEVFGDVPAAAAYAADSGDEG